MASEGVPLDARSQFDKPGSPIEKSEGGLGLTYAVFDVIASSIVSSRDAVLAGGLLDSIDHVGIAVVKDLVGPELAHALMVAKGSRGKNSKAGEMSELDSMMSDTGRAYRSSQKRT